MLSQFADEVSQLILGLVSVERVIPLLELRGSRKRDAFFLAEELKQSTPHGLHVCSDPGRCGFDGVPDSAPTA